MIRDTMPKTPIFLLFNHLLILLLLLPNQPALAAVNGGRWNLLLRNIGVSAMHMQLLSTDRVVIFDRTDFGASNISLPNNRCRNNRNDRTLRVDCTAHSVEYDVASNSIRPLFVFTNPWCSSGATMADGSLMQSGGFNDGDRSVRLYGPCSSSNACDWREFNAVLTQRRWYATSQILPDGRMIIIGGRGQFNYEFYPKRAGATGVFNLPFLAQTNDPRIENNLYPFVFLNVDGNLFIFANNRAILFDYIRAVVVRTYPAISPDPRSYPSSGSAVMLPIRGGGSNIAVEVLVCGGAPRGSFIRANNGNFDRALNTCGRIRITDPNPQWLIETMPSARVMGDMVLLPNGNVLILNGASAGTSGWDLGNNPELTPVMYRPDNPARSRFELQRRGTIPRMYHSTAVLLRDGRVLVAGSNPHAFYNFTGVRFPTDLTMEAFSPDYLDAQFARLRPRILTPASQSVIGYGRSLTVAFTSGGRVNGGTVRVTMVAPPFNTHAFSMNQRLVVLPTVSVTPTGGLNYQIRVLTPGSNIIAPSGFYLLFVVYQEIPSPGIWVQII